MGEVLWKCLPVVDFCELFVLSDSLSCESCESFNSSCIPQIAHCEEGFISCVQSSVNSTLGEWGYFHLWDLWEVGAQEDGRKEGLLSWDQAV